MKMGWMNLSQCLVSSKNITSSFGRGQTENSIKKQHSYDHKLNVKVTKISKSTKNIFWGSTQVMFLTTWQV